MSIKMEDWRKKIKRGDIAEVCRRIGVTTQVYYDSLTKSNTEWTSSQFSVNIELKKMIEERENFIAETVQ